MTAQLEEYQALCAKVDAFAAGVTARRGVDLACRKGCDGCCQVSLTVSAVEREAVRAHLRSLPLAPRQRLRLRAAADSGARCVMLEADGACAIYEARPLVCRTQGLPLRYPAALVPATALLGRAGEGAVTCCPLNFTARLPSREDILDAVRVDELLAVVNRRFVAARGEDPLGRTALVVLAAD